MATKTPRFYLEHIQESIAAIERYVAGKTFEHFARDDLLRDGVERRIEIISEASRRLPEEMKTRHPEVPWGAMPASATSFVTTTTPSTPTSSGGSRPRTSTRSVRRSMPFWPSFCATGKGDDGEAKGRAS